MNLIRKNKMNLMVFYLIFRKIYRVGTYSVLKKVDDKKIVFMGIIDGTCPVKFIKQQITAHKLIFAELLNS